MALSLNRQKPVQHTVGIYSEQANHYGINAINPLFQAKMKHWRRESSVFRVLRSVFQLALSWDAIQNQVFKDKINGIHNFDR
jgi:hypothetical protein